MMIAVVTPFAILSNWNDDAHDRRLRRDARLRADRLRRRLHEDRQAPLARACARAPSWSCWRRSRSGCGCSRAHALGCSSTLRLRFVDYTVDLGVFYPFLIYLVVAGTTSGVNLTDGLDGLAAGCAAIVLLAYVGDHLPERPRRRRRTSSWRCWRPASSAPASASSGSTPSRRRSSWATPARSGSAARSPGSP